MTLAKRILGGQSALGNRLFAGVLKLLDSPGRLTVNDPDALLEGAGDLTGKTVLEIGCGSGFFTLRAASLIGSGGTLYSTDIQPLAVEMTANKVREAGLANVIARKEDATRTSFGDAAFDAVLLYGVVPAPFISVKALFAEIFRVLKPRGTCAIWTAIPLWRPYRTGKRAGFERVKPKNGVFRLRKPETAREG